MRGLSCNSFSSDQCPGYIQVLKSRKTAVTCPLSRADDVLQSGLVLGSGSSVPDSDGGGENGLYDGSVEVHHHCLWQVEFLQVLQKEHPLLCLFDDREDVRLPSPRS